MTHHRRHRHHERSPAPRAGTAAGLPTPAPATGPVRASDADRERVVELLRRHAATGRLDAEEFEARLDRAYAATYLGEAEATLTELPPEPDPAPAAARAPRRGPSAPLATAAIIVAAAAVLALVTALTGVWALWWLMWPVAVVAKGLGRRRRPRQGTWGGPRHEHRGAAA